MPLDCPCGHRDVGSVCAAIGTLSSTTVPTNSVVSCRLCTFQRTQCVEASGVDVVWPLCILPVHESLDYQFSIQHRVVARPCVGVEYVILIMRQNREHDARCLCL